MDSICLALTISRMSRPLFLLPHWTALKVLLSIQDPNHGVKRSFSHSLPPQMTHTSNLPLFTALSCHHPHHISSSSFHWLSQPPGSSCSKHSSLWFFRVHSSPRMTPSFIHPISAFLDFQQILTSTYPETGTLLGTGDRVVIRQC